MRRSVARAMVLFVALVAASCGDSRSPTAPTSPVSAPPAPTPPAVQQANLIVVGTLDFVSCINGLCSFRGLARNTGNACAVNISGEAWIMSAQGQEITRARWAMLPQTVLRPGDEAYYDGEGMSQAALNHLDGRYFASFLFDSRPC